MAEDDYKKKKKDRVCVTGGSGFLGSWLIMRLLQHGYSVNTTVRTQSAGSKKDISFLTSLPDASERLHVFTADLENPESFAAAIEGCIGVFHVAHPIDFQNKETEETITNKSIGAALGILKACVETKTVRRVVYTSSASTVMFNDEAEGAVLDEGSWTDVDYVRNEKHFGASYFISKTLTERAALEFAEKHSLDLVTVIPTWIHGPFISPSCPGSVQSSLAMLIGNEKQIRYCETTPFVHTDDVASAHIFLFEYPEAKGRYICSAVEITVDKLHEFLSTRYPEFKVLSAEFLIDEGVKLTSLSSRKLLDTGFRYKYGLEEMFDEAIECCRQKGFI
ncbi:Vestitone reductase [Sesamum alatum]|uniref:Dihydroflavonol 4-reductase n=1 Tax=Sesamum alatum TaxID=300844 RepID=A0AAE1XNF1_9LAMI|nr:Vestitone reductase [Sesamum alatum]